MFSLKIPQGHLLIRWGRPGTAPIIIFFVQNAKRTVVCRYTENSSLMADAGGQRGRNTVGKFRRVFSSLRTAS